MWRNTTGLTQFLFSLFFVFRYCEKDKIWEITIFKNYLKLVHVRYFRTLFWDDITIIWDENIVYFFNWEKNPVLDQQEVCLLNFHQQIIVISSQNNVQKHSTKGHEQVYCVHNCEKFLPIAMMSFQLNSLCAGILKHGHLHSYCDLSFGVEGSWVIGL